MSGQRRADFDPRLSGGETLYGLVHFLVAVYVAGALQLNVLVWSPSQLFLGSMFVLWTFTSTAWMFEKRCDLFSKYIVKVQGLFALLSNCETTGTAQSELLALGDGSACGGGNCEPTSGRVRQGTRAPCSARLVARMRFPFNVSSWAKPLPEMPSNYWSEPGTKC